MPEEELYELEFILPLPPVQSDFPVQPFFPLQPLEPVQSDFPVQPLTPLQVDLPWFWSVAELSFCWLSPMDDPQAQPPTELPMARPIKANLTTLFFIASLPKIVYANCSQEIMRKKFYVKKGLRRADGSGFVSCNIVCPKRS
jgi:hypothetical protein